MSNCTEKSNKNEPNSQKILDMGNNNKSAIKMRNYIKI